MMINPKINYIFQSYPMKAEVKAEWNFEASFIKNSKIGNR